MEDPEEDECKSLLQTLPSEIGWGGVKVYLYNGFWYNLSLLNGVLSVQHNFQADHSDILLATIPKSGTTWIKALVFALLNRSRYSLAPNTTTTSSTSNYYNHPLLQNNPHDLVPFLEINLFIKDHNPDLSCFEAPRLFHTHIPFTSLPVSVKSSKCKIVYLCRSPKDTVISLWHFSNKLIPKDMSPVSLEDAFEKFCRGISAYGPFWDHALEYWKASEEMPHKVLFLKYEEIKEQPYEQLRRLADFLGCPFSREEETNGQVEEILRMCSFESLSRLEVNMSGKISSGVESKHFFRRGNVGDSANYLTREMIERIDHITEVKLHDSTLKL